MSQPKLTIGDITRIIAKYETINNLTISPANDQLYRNYMKSIEGKEKELIKLYVEAKFKETMDLCKPILQIETPEA